MSTTANVADIDKLKNSLAEIRADNGTTERKAWVIVGHVDNNPNQVDVVAEDNSPEACLEDLRSRLEDDQMCYCLLRLTTIHDMSTTVKFVYIHWIGDSIPFAKKGRFGVVHGSVQEHFHPYHLLVETGSREDLEEEKLIKQLEESSGTRNHVIEGSTAGMQQRGFTAHQINREVKGTVKSVAPAGAQVETSPELQEAIGEVRQDSSEASWVLAGFEEGNLKKPLTLVAKGSGDIEDLKNNLDDAQVMYGLYRTSDTIDDIKTVKFVFIYWIGENVKPMTKGKVSAYAGPVERIFSPAHATLSFSSKYDIEESIITDKVMAGSGSKSFVK